MNILQKNQYINAIEHVLHVPGNYRGGILEMAVVLDTDYPAEKAKECIREHLFALKQHSSLFSNVRLNLILWGDGGSITSSVVSMSMLMLGRGLNQPASGSPDKSFASLCSYLKKFHARSKIILLFTEKNYTIPKTAVRDECLQPFLGKKLLIIDGSQTITAAAYLNSGHIG